LGQNNNLLQVSLIWRSILDTVGLKKKLTLGTKRSEREDQVFTLHELVPTLDLGKNSTLAQHSRLVKHKPTPFPNILWAKNPIFWLSVGLSPVCFGMYVISNAAVA
jgi:hypothetical protein